MVVGEKEKTLEEKLAKSSGSDTAKYSEELDAKADKIINEMNEAAEDEGKKAEEKVNELNKNLEAEDEAKKTEEEAKEKESKEDEEKKPDLIQEGTDDEIKPDDGDTVESLTEKLTKSEKRVKDNRSAFTKNKQELRDKSIASQTVIDTLKETIADLQTKVEARSTTTSVKEEKTTEKEIAKKLVNLDKQFETLKNVDPEIAGPLKEIIDNLRDGYTSEITGLTNQVSNLKTELKNSTETAQKSAQEIADDKHYGKIEDAHSDWETIIDSPEFDAYIETLSPRHQVLARQDIKSGTADNIIELFSDYKTAVGITKEDDNETNKDTDTKTDAKAKKLEAAKKMVNPALNKSKEIKTGTAIKYTRSMIKAMSPQEFAKHEPDIDKEAAAGRIGNE